MSRICFLFNHDQLHQVAHSLPIALTLAEGGGAEVTLAVASDALAAHVRRLAGDRLAACRLVQLTLASPVTRMLARTLDRVLPAHKILLYRENVAFFRQFDALVVSEKTTLLLKTRYGLDKLKIIHTRHGAGDRAIGFGRESALFDLVLVSGPKIARRLVAEAGVDPARIRMVGYPKFDLFADASPVALPFPDPSRPVVLYSPHPSPGLSSWYGMGQQVLDAFAASDRFNLIFAPHVMLFQRHWTVTISPPALRRVRQPRIMHASNILMDPGSPASSDMSYTNRADLYIGDVSSQIYEYLLRPRPCVALDAHGADWQGNPNYTHWQAGPVVGPGTDIIAAVEQAMATHADYLPVQQALLADTFSVTDRPSAQRSAEAITRFMAGESACD
ncbi:hypothetical protein PK98_04175 [Croceibacterium mercuriale]|uniref:Glycosyl transferase n=1 Tax=Croceibacterium mercuriale TaxID=1572751 RepID=A0A0B2C0M4_9SPHN|nr:hypothetical protein [Croceibacterium mercuriale]KHL25812.1 hypothetical protein PK98_04175 [Croceibacterium mercuriale]